MFELVLLTQSKTTYYVGILKLSISGGELTRNINQKKKSDSLQVYRCSLCDKCCR